MSTHPGSPTTTWFLPTGLAPYDNVWIIGDPFGGSVYIQEQGTTAVSAFAAPGLLDVPFGVLSVDATLFNNPLQFIINELDQAELYFIGIPNRKYRVQRSLDLQNWTDLGMVTALPNGDVLFTDPSPPSPRVFYRLSD